MPAAALVAAGVLGAGATIYAANKASQAQTQATNTATDAELKMFGITRDSLQPFIDSGSQAGGTLNKLLSPNGGIDQSVLESLPGYQFNLTQGLKAVQNSAAARGLGSSGAALKGAATYASGLADSTYGTYVNQLLGQEGIGANAAAGLGGNATQTGAQIGSNAIGAGNAAAGAATATGNAVANLGGDIAQAALLNKLLAAGGGSTSMYAPAVGMGALY
jgi:hypothetical protein